MYADLCASLQKRSIPFRREIKPRRPPQNVHRFIASLVLTLNNLIGQLDVSAKVSNRFTVTGCAGCELQVKGRMVTRRQRVSV